VNGWLDLPTKRAKDNAAEKLAALEAHLGELERQREDAKVVDTHYRELRDLQAAIAEAKHALRSGSGERALR
jgi:hypothetical protein